MRRGINETPRRFFISSHTGADSRPVSIFAPSERRIAMLVERQLIAGRHSVRSIGTSDSEAP